MGVLLLRGRHVNIKIYKEMSLRAFKTGSSKSGPNGKQWKRREITL